MGAAVRQNRTPQASKTDIAAWRRLVRVARLSAATPAANCGDLTRAERTARRSIVIGILSRENACVVLDRLARQYADSTARQRRELAPALLAACDQVDAALQSAALAAEQGPPALRHRADLDD